MNLSESFKIKIATAIGAMLSSIISGIIIALLGSIIIHFTLNDNIISILILYISVATFSSVMIFNYQEYLKVFRSRDALPKSYAIVLSIFVAIIVFFLMYITLPIIFGFNYSFPLL